MGTRRNWTLLRAHMRRYRLSWEDIAPLLSTTGQELKNQYLQAINWKGGRPTPWIF